MSSDTYLEPLLYINIEKFLPIIRQPKNASCTIETCPPRIRSPGKMVAAPSKTVPLLIRQLETVCLHR